MNTLNKEMVARIYAISGHLTEFMAKRPGIVAEAFMPEEVIMANNMLAEMEGFLSDIADRVENEIKAADHDKDMAQCFSGWGAVDCEEEIPL